MKELVKIFLFIILGVLVIFGMMVACDSALLYPFELTEYVVVEEGVTIAYDELDEPPVYFGNSIAPITKFKLKHYMKTNQVKISSGEYVFSNTIRFEKLIEVLNFE